MDSILKVSNISKSFGDFKIKNLSLDVPKGAVIGFVGENGAGKTTVIRLMLDIIKRDAGNIEIFGKDNIEFGDDIKQDIGVVLDQSFFYEGVTSYEISDVLKNIYTNWDNDKFKDLLIKFNIDGKKAIKELSKGMKMKLNIATALSHNPKLLILDEPMDGLDPRARNEMEDVFREFIQDSEHSIFISSHITSDLERFADYIVLIHKGSIVFHKTKDEVLESYGLLKCGIDDFDSIEKQDIKGFRKNLFGYEIMVDNKEDMLMKYPNFIIDSMNIEEIMFFYERGEKI